MKVCIDEQTASGFIHHEYEIGSECLFEPLTNECDKTIQIYGVGKEKKEVANIKYRAESTVVNHIQNAFKKLGINNGREYSIMLAFKIVEKLLGNVKITMGFSPIARSVIACCLLCVFSLSLYHEQGEMRRSRRIRVERVERYRRYDGNT